MGLLLLSVFLQLAALAAVDFSVLLLLLHRPRHHHRLDIQQWCHPHAQVQLYSTAESTSIQSNELSAFDQARRILIEWRKDKTYN
jgi:hypothetical protein